MTFDEWFLSLEEWSHSETALARHAWDAAYKQAYNDAYADAAYPIGYVLVPREPTEKMVDAFWSAVEVGNEAKLIDVFTAMINAAQEEE